MVVGPLVRLKVINNLYKPHLTFTFYFLLEAIRKFSKLRSGIGLPKPNVPYSAAEPPIRQLQCPRKARHCARRRQRFGAVVYFHRGMLCYSMV